MRRVVGEIAQEGLVFVLLHKLEGMVGEVVDDESLAPDNLAVVLENRAEIVAPVAGREAIILVEAAGVGVVASLLACWSRRRLATSITHRDLALPLLPFRAAHFQHLVLRQNQQRLSLPDVHWARG